jgi:hypothetical protein
MLLNAMRLSMLMGVLVLPGCFDDKVQIDGESKRSEVAKPIMIQLLFNSSALSAIKQRITPLINEIVKEELGLGQASESKFFSPKEAPRLTLYYINERQPADSELEAAFDKITVKSAEASLSHVKFVSEVEFFGGPFGLDDELVIKIDDSKGELLALHEICKTEMHAANQAYLAVHRHALYNLTESEKHSYLPHVGLGRLRSGSIKESVGDVQFGSLFAKIQARIKVAVTAVVEEVLAGDLSAVRFDELCLFDLGKRSCLKEFSLKCSESAK